MEGRRKGRRKGRRRGRRRERGNGGRKGVEIVSCI